MNIDQLPENCLLVIFNHLSLSDRLNLECVCQRWRILSEHLGFHQQTVKIFANRDCLNQFAVDVDYNHQLKTCPYFQSTNDVLLIANLDLIHCRLLVRMFPRLQMILLDGCETTESNLHFLLTQYKQTLKCLSLIDLIGISWNTFPLYPYTNLIHLAVRGDSQVIDHDFVKNQLKELYTNCLYPGIRSLDKQITKLSIGGVCNSTQVSWLNEAQFGINLTHLTIGCDVHMKSATQKQLLEVISIKFPSLTYLNLLVSEYGVSKNSFRNSNHSFNQILQIKLHLLCMLNQLTSLRELHLRAPPSGSVATAESNTTEWFFYSQLDSVKTLAFDIDFEQNTFSLIQWLFPNLTELSVNVSRICCVCVDVPEFPDRQPPMAEQPNQLPVDGNGMRPEPIQHPQPLPPPEPEPNIEVVIIEENCDKCCQSVMQIMSRWANLRHLSITGSECNEAIIRSLEMHSHLDIVSFATCQTYSLVSLLATAKRIAQQHDPHRMFVLKLAFEKFSRIIKLPQKAQNLCVMNVSYLV